jgi:hypothetical protein
MLRRFRIGIAILSVLSVLAGSAAIPVIQVRWRVASVDAAFEQIQRGDRSADVVARMGPPQRIREPSQLPPWGKATLYCYEARTLGPFPVRWTVWLDSAGVVRGKVREDDGC